MVEPKLKSIRPCEIWSFQIEEILPLEDPIRLDQAHKTTPNKMDLMRRLISSYHGNRDLFTAVRWKLSVVKNKHEKLSGQNTALDE